MPTIREIIIEVCLANDCMEVSDSKVEFSNRLTTTGGRAYYKQNRLVFSRSLWEKATYEQKANLVAHEICHVIAYRKYGARGHCQTFYDCGRKAGYILTRCHDIQPDKIRRNRRVSAYCSCQTHSITTNRETRMKRGQRYICNRCRTHISLTRN